MNSHSIERLSQVIPALAEKITKLAEMCDLDPVFTTENAKLEITQGLRTWDDQAKLFALGRTVPGREVTNARPGESWHNFGCAVDVAPFIGDAQPDWDEAHQIWARIVELGESLGLRSGVSWKDEPHFECTGNFPPKPPQEVIDAFHTSGIVAVWSLIETS
jgi:peptidoglycan L-alanyl-D-glutamate endopeptidase CwlK